MSVFQRGVFIKIVSVKTLHVKEQPLKICVLSLPKIIEEKRVLTNSNYSIYRNCQYGTL